MIAGHGPNIGHGYVKYVLIDGAGRELPPVVSPATIAPSQRAIAGSLREAATVIIDDGHYWTGDDAQLSPNPLTMLSQERLSDAVFIPALVRGALRRFGHLNGASGGYCVSGLPATWAQDWAMAKALGARLRAGHSGYAGIRIIAEPLGLIYAQLLDNDGDIVGQRALSDGRIGVIDIGHHTVDLAVVARLQPEPSSLETFQLGTAVPLRQIRATLSAAFDRDLSLRETDLAVRASQLAVAGSARDLPAGWDRPLREHGAAVAARIVEAWGSGARLDTILIGGGGGNEARLVEAITARFPHASVVTDPQLAIARGYARLARRFGAQAK